MLIDGLCVCVCACVQTYKKRTLVCLDSKQVEWPRPVWSVLRVGSLKRPKHAVHEE